MKGKIFSLETSVALTSGLISTSDQREEVFKLLDFMTGKYVTPCYFEETARICREALVAQHPCLEVSTDLAGGESVQAVFAEQERILREVRSRMKIDHVLVAPIFSKK